MILDPAIERAVDNDPRFASWGGWKDGEWVREYLRKWHQGILPSAYGNSARIGRMRRGKYVRIPPEWRGQTTDPSTIRKRQSKKPHKMHRLNHVTGERLTVQERRAPTIEEFV